MVIRSFTKRFLQASAAFVLVPYLILVAVAFLCQRSIIFFPTHRNPPSRLTPWTVANRTIGYCRVVPNAKTVWLMTHGNAGQAADRDYVLNRISAHDSLYVLEYPGYGSRDGRPGRQSIDQAAAEAYRILRSKYSQTPVCALGESIGSGPACSLARQQTPPDKIVLIVPFDTLKNVAARRFYFLPVRLLLRDDWNNVEALRNYSQSVDIFGALEDDIIPVEHARALAEQIPNGRFIPVACGHNDWSLSEQINIQR